jgi:hypothetical protein
MTKVFHASILPWNLASQAPVIHVGTYEQADCVHRDYEYESQTTLYFYISDDIEGFEDITKVRVLHNGSEIFPLYIVLDSPIFSTVLTDTEANTVHTLHAHEHRYPISTSVYNTADMSLVGTTNVVQALSALNNNTLIPYTNTSEGPTGGISYLVPNPQSNLILRGVPSVRPSPNSLLPRVSLIEKSLGRVLDVRLTRGKP